VHALSDGDVGEADGLGELFDRPFASRWLISAARSYTPRTAPRVPMDSADGRVKVRNPRPPTLVACAVRQRVAPLNFC